MTQGIYLYCFARPAATNEIAPVAVDGSEGVRTLQVREVAAVFSRVSRDEFSPDASHLQDPAWVIPRACRHDRVIQEVMSRSPVLPVRFGAIFSSKEVLAKLLTDHYGEMSRFLDDISDKQEWAVKGFVDAGKAEACLMSSDPALSEQRRHLPVSPGMRYFQQKRLRGQAHQEVKSWCRSIAKQVGEKLVPMTLSAHPLRPQARGLSGKDADIFYNCAFLLLGSTVAEFQRAVHELAAEYREQGILWELSGPWPPYSFCPQIGELRQ